MFEYTLKILWRSDLIWLRYSRSKTCLFVCLFVFFILIILEHPQEYTLKIPWRSDLIWLRYIGFLKNVYLFVYLFVDLLFFILIILGHPQEYNLKILRGSDLIWLRYSGSKKCLFVCLCVCLFVNMLVFYFHHLGTPTGICPENFMKIRLDLAEI